MDIDGNTCTDINSAIVDSRGRKSVQAEIELINEYAVGKRYSEDDTINDQNERFDIMKGIAHNN